jgi:6-phosphofructokinase
MADGGKLAIVVGGGLAPGIDSVIRAATGLTRVRETEPPPLVL